MDGNCSVLVLPALDNVFHFGSSEQGDVGGEHVLVQSQVGEFLAFFGGYQTPVHARVLFVQRPTKQSQIVANLYR